MQATRTDQGARTTIRCRACVCVVLIGIGIGLTGCVAEVSYVNLFDSTATLRQIETATRSDLGGNPALRLGLDASFPMEKRFGVTEGDKTPIYATGLLSFDTQWIGQDVRLSRAIVQPTLVWVFRKDNALSLGVGAGWHELAVDGLPDTDAFGVYIDVALGRLPNLGGPSLSLNVRKYFMEFDTDYGDLDANGFEISVRARVSSVLILGIVFTGLGYLSGSPHGVTH